MLPDSYFEGDQYATSYGDVYKVKINELKRNIVDCESSNDKFIVLNIEASLGKSYNTNKIIKQYISDFTNQKKFLIVKRFRRDIEETENFIGEHVNNEFNTTVLGITSENWKEWQHRPDKLKEIQVLIISHQRYISLCEKNEMREVFMDGRHTLIIDEKIDFPVLTFSKQAYDEIHNCLPFGLENELSDLCKPLKDMLSFFYNDTKTRNECIFCNPETNMKHIDNFEQLIEDNKDNIGRDKLYKIREFIERIRIIYTTKCIYNGGRISTYNRKHRLWGLKNNIILDASGAIDYIYRLSESNYKLNRQIRIVDDSKINIHPIMFNSSKSKINGQKKEFFDEIVKLIKERMIDEDRILLMCHKDNADTLRNTLIAHGVSGIGFGEDYEDENVAVNWFGNVIGSNLYSNFNVCWILGKPNIPLETYVIHYMQHSNADSVGRKPMKIQGGKFKNKTFRSVQDGEIASEIYQSIKRIQRNHLPIGDIYIVIDDDEVLKKVIDDMKHPQVYEKRAFLAKINEKTKQKEDKIDELVNYFKELGKGKYPKKQVCEENNISDKHLFRYINNVKIKTLVEARVIKVERISIIKL